MRLVHIFILVGIFCHGLPAIANQDADSRSLSKELESLSKKNKGVDEDLSSILESEKKGKSKDADIKNFIKEIEENSKKNGALGKELSAFINSDKEINVQEVAAPIAQPAAKAVPQKDFQLLAFISSSIPMSSLIKIGKEVKEEDGFVLMQGFVKESFVETEKFLSPYVEEVNDGISVDPEIFNQYEITSVPCYVLVNNKDPQQFDKMCGQVSVAYFLEQSKKEGVMKEGT